MNSLKSTLASLTASLALLAPANAQLLNSSGTHVMLGGGYLEEPSTAYGFLRLGWIPYEDAAFTHTIFGELLIHGDDSQLDFIGPGGIVLFSEDADLVFVNLTANYELEAKLFEPVSLYAGAGAGTEAVSINDRFDESLDDDWNFLAQVFFGVRISISNSAKLNIGARRIFREDFSLLGDQFITEDAWGLELGVSARF